MAMENRKPAQRKRYQPSLKYFYLDGDLHKVLSVNRAGDLAVCWNYPKDKRVGYIWSDLKRRHGKAFSMIQVGQMIGRNRVTIERDILNGRIKPPQRTYNLSSRLPKRYYFSEKDIMDYHDYLMTVRLGRPRADDVEIRRNDMPSKAEIRAMINNEVTTYVKNEQGEFVPVWREQTW